MAHVEVHFAHELSAHDISNFRPIGGAPVDLVAGGNERNPQISPDGRLLAYFFNDEQTKRPKLAVIDAEGGAPVKTFDLPVSSLGVYDTF